MFDTRQRQLCADLGELLSYPGAGVPALGRHALAIAGVGNPGAASLARFVAFAERLGQPGLEELYTATFDLAPACAPYLGAQLCGEDGPQRGPLLARLAELYAADGFRARQELPDHVAEVLAFLAVASAGEARDDLLRDGLLPTLDRMIAALTDESNAYRELLLAARTLLAPGDADRQQAPPPPRDLRARSAPGDRDGAVTQRPHVEGRDGRTRPDGAEVLP